LKWVHQFANDPTAKPAADPTRIARFSRLNGEECKQKAKADYRSYSSILSHISIASFLACIN
jgi:hypothetical protein